MIVEKNTFNDEDGSLGWIECIYDSSNILESIYFPKNNLLYISFKNGITYRYYDISDEFYNKFESAESQGKFLVNEIKKANLPYTKEFKLYESEIEQKKNKILEWKKNQQ